MIEIAPEEIKFNNTSYIDPNGRVFEWKGEIYRAIPAERANFYRWLIKQDFYKKLQSEKKIIETDITNYHLNGYEIVLKHRKINFLSYCFEWPPEMLKDAAILTLEICLELAKHNLMLQDAYPFNVQFEGTRPIFIDVSSICEADKDIIWSAYQQFCNFFLYPLYIYSAKGPTAIVRRMLFDYLNGISERECLDLLPFSYKLSHPNIFTRVTFPLIISNFYKRLGLENKIYSLSKRFTSKIDVNIARVKFIEGLLKETISLNLSNSMGISYWRNYYINGNESYYAAKEKIVAEIIDRLNPCSMLHIGSNIGRFPILATKKEKCVIGCDKDAESISVLYNTARNEHLQILPLVLDILNPSPQFGWCLRQFPSAIDRFKTDMVFALALIHHLIFTYWQNFERLCELFDCLSNKYLLIEFIPKDDPMSQKLLLGKKDIFGWYSLENFISSLKKHFKNIEIFDLPPTTRRLLLCEK